MVREGDQYVFNICVLQGEEPSKSKEGSENGKKDVTSAGRCIIHTLHSTHVLSHHDKAQVNFTIATHNRK